MSDDLARVIPISSRRTATAVTDPRPAPDTHTVEQAGTTDDSPPTPTELMNAGLYWNGYINGPQLARICGNQVRAGRAIDATNPSERNRNPA